MDYYHPMLTFNRFSLVIALVCSLSAYAQAPETKPVAPLSSGLNGEIFYQLLVGELNAREGDPSAAYALMLDAARKTQTPQLYQRAVDIALQARSGDSALFAAKAWRQALPSSKQANLYVLQILIGLNRIAEAVEPLKQELAAADAKNRAATVLGLPRYFALASDKKAVVLALELALNDYLNISTPDVAVAAWTVIGHSRLAAGAAAAAFEAARKAQALDPKSEHPALLALALISPPSPQAPQAEALVKKYLEGKPLALVRMAYARVLIDSLRLAEAMTQLQTATTEKPDYAHAWLLKGALALQDGKLAPAEKSLKRYIELALPKLAGESSAQVQRGLVQAYLSMAEIAEQRKDFVEAGNWLSRIDTPSDQFKIQLRRASLLAQQGKLDEARALIKSLQEQSDEEARLKVSTEIALLRDSKQYKPAYALLLEAVTNDPTDQDFVYDLAMMAEKLGNLDEMERLLRQVMASKPSYHAAYNALGYSLADRNIRLPESKQLILKALEFSPNDPFIKDSLGWVEFRSANMEAALRLLQEAFRAKPDAEIAAHLGEVQWAVGRSAQALLTFKAGLKLNPENETLLETIKRLQVKL